LREKLKRPELEQFAQRISIDYFLAPLNQSETEAYIEHRVAHAGGKNPLFDAPALALIYQCSGGIPRVINRLCDLSLVYGYAENVRTIGADLVKAVVNKKDLESTNSTQPGKSSSKAAQHVAPDKEPAAEKQVALKKTSKQVKHNKPAYPGAEKGTAPDKQRPGVINANAGGGKMAKSKESAKSDKMAAPRAAQSEELKDISAEAAVKRREQLERIAAEKAQTAMAAVETAAANLAAAKLAESEQQAAMKRLQEAESVGENTSQLAAAAKTAVELTMAERKAAEADVLEKKKSAELACDKAKIEKATAEKRVAQITGIEEEARLAAEQAIATAEKALAERVAAEKAAADAAAAATELVNRAVEERIAVETETSSRLAEAEQAAALAAAEENRASQTAAEKENSEKAARAQAEACLKMAEEKEAGRAEAALLAEEKTNAAINAQKISHATHEAAEKAVAEQMEAEKAAVSSATIEKVAMASVAADEAAEALRLAKRADVAKQAALREAEQAKAAAELAARRAADARAAAEQATAVENTDADENVVEAIPVPVRLTEDAAMKELIVSGAHPTNPGIKEGRSHKGKAWAAMAVTAVVAGAAWFVTQSDRSSDDAGTETLAGKGEKTQSLSTDVKVETAAMEISGKPRKQ
jgi:hypothetical protein